MKAKELKSILSNVDDEADIDFIRYDHFLEEYEAYDFDRIGSRDKENTYSIELTRKSEDDKSLIPTTTNDDSDEEEEDLRTQEMFDDIMDEGFVANL